MKRPDTKVLSALASLDGTQEFGVVMEWITSSLHDELESLITADVARVQRQQGYCQALTELMQHALQARENLRKTGR